MKIMVNGKMYDSDESPVFVQMSRDEIESISGTKDGITACAPAYAQDNVIYRLLDTFKKLTDI